MPATHRPAVALAVGFLLVGLTRAEDGPRTDKLNASFAKLTLTNPDGKAVALADLKDPKAVVVVFLSFDCPVSNGYTTYLNELAKKHAAAGVTVLGIIPTDDSPADVKKHAAEF